LTRAACLFAALLLVAAPAGLAHASPGDGCSGAYAVDETLPSGARWQLCWEHHPLSGILYGDVYFTPRGGSARKVLYEASLAQIHVPYDDNGARFHDVTDYGLGDEDLNALTSADCPNGTRLFHGSKPVLCKRVQRIEPGYQHRGRRATGFALELFSVSHVGAYNYIPTWRFHDDGKIAPTVGATGALQRFGTDPLYGWPIRPSGTTGVSHIHNYWFRLDFDFDEGTDREVVDEVDHVRVGLTREKQVTTFQSESARSLDLGRRRSWRIRDLSVVASDGRSLSYQLEPSHHAHRFDGPSFEPWSAHQLYVTRYADCEKYATHNSLAGGCGSDVTSFVNGQNAYGQDLVLWYGLTFHHLPSDEDEPNMHAHWDGFEIVPRDWTPANPLPLAPSIASPGNPVSRVGQSVSLPLATSNPSGAALAFSASGLPPGLAISSATGRITGAALSGSAGNHAVTVTSAGTLGGQPGLVSDSLSFVWTVTNAVACDDGVDNDRDGATDLADRGCASATDATERSAGVACDDGFDDDGDDLVDVLDPGCANAQSTTESPACNDGADNDGDRLIDGVDPDCAVPSDPSEAPSVPWGCGLGPELALLLAPWLWLRRRRGPAA